MGDDKLFEYDDGLPPVWVCIVLVITMPFWLPVALVGAAICWLVKEVQS